MPKFIIDNIIIEKSEKDIKTGIKYNFENGFNIICGDNEAGKSSLMTFIKECFFRPNKVDTGKVLFSVCDNDKKVCYRADIKNNQKKEKRCTLFEENGSTCDYSILENLINKKYYEAGFTINLDDLNNIQYDNNKTLANVIKDPSGDKLNEFLKKISTETDFYIGINGKSKKPLSEIINNINSIQNRINELSQKENLYNNTVLNISEINEELQNLLKEEEFIKLTLQSDKLKKELYELNEKYQILKEKFNLKLYNSKEQYFEILQNVGKYESNKELLNKNNQKIEQHNSNINMQLNRFNSDFLTNSDENSMAEFDIDYSKVNRIKELLSNIESLNNEIKAYEKTIEDIEQTKIKLKNDLEYLKKDNNQSINIFDLETIYNKIDEGLKQYRYIETELTAINQTTKPETILSVKNIMMIISILFIISTILTVLSFYSEISSTIVFSVFLGILLMLGTIVLKKGNSQISQNNEKERKESQQKSILENITELIKDEYPNIKETEPSYLPVKLDEIRQEINTKLINLKTFNEKIIQNEQDTEFNNRKIENNKDKINLLNSKIIECKEEIEQIKSSDNIQMNFDVKQYLNAIDIIKTIKTEINNKKLLEKENEELNIINNEIIKSFNNFIISNEVNFDADIELKDNINRLKLINDNNNNIKQEMDLLNVAMNSKETEIKEINLSEFQNFNIIANAERLEEINILKKQTQAQKTEAEFQKRELEAFEGITDLKNEKNLLLNEYRNIIKKLFINKAICKITSIAKNNFDKTQPDLVNAQKYLSILTGNKYTKINLETEEILNENGSIIKKWNELSRGTKEQLYLALRLGYASNYSKDKSTLKPNGKPNLPLIVDDAFVNFDYKRTHNALKCLIEFSKTNQVIFFTCHTEIIKQHLKEITEEENFNIISIN